MPDLLRHADIAVLPTSYFEGVPQFLVEAAATGLPLVASDIPGCRIVVGHEVNGLLVPPCDTPALAQALGRLLADAPLRRRFGEASRRLALTEFSEEKIVDDYLALYRQLGILDQRSTVEPCGRQRK
jgi:glycosyltransferase involved in cell wall biosynthesis